jgi:phosphate acetyltransferase
MNILDRIRQRAASRPQHIVLPEGNDPRTVAAAAEATSQRIARITVLGDEETIRGVARDNHLDLGGVTISDHKRAADFDRMVSLFHELRRAKGLMADEARTLVSDPLYYGNLMVRSGLRRWFGGRSDKHDQPHRSCCGFTVSACDRDLN